MKDVVMSAAKFINTCDLVGGIMEMLRLGYNESNIKPDPENEELINVVGDLSLEWDTCFKRLVDEYYSLVERETFDECL